MPFSLVVAEFGVAVVLFFHVILRIKYGESALNVVFRPILLVVVYLMRDEVHGETDDEGLGSRLYNFSYIDLVSLDSCFC